MVDFTAHKQIKETKTQKMPRSNETEDDIAAGFHPEQVNIMQLQRLIGNQAVQRILADDKLDDNGVLRPHSQQVLPSLFAISTAETSIQRQINDGEWKKIKVHTNYNYCSKLSFQWQFDKIVMLLTRILQHGGAAVTNEHMIEVARVMGIDLPDDPVFIEAEEELDTSKAIVYQNGISEGDCSLTESQLSGLRQGTLRSRHGKNHLPTKANPGHQHANSGSGGISFFYKDDGTPVIYDYATSRGGNKGNTYYWKNGSKSGGPSSAKKE